MESPTTKKVLLAMGFKTLETISELHKKTVALNSDQLRSAGVYAIACKAEYKHAFFNFQEIKEHHNVIHPCSDEDKLEHKWVNNVEVLYFGKAGTSLHNRLYQLIRHSLGHITDGGPHKGGEIIWQLRGYENFEVLYLPIENSNAASNMETHLISEFQDKTRKLPFANRNRGNC